MGVIDNAKAAIKGANRRLVMPEGRDERILEAASRLHREGLAVPMVLDNPLFAPAPKHIDVLLASCRKMTPSKAERLLARPLYRASAMLAAGEADAMLAGAASPTARVIEAALMTVGLEPGISLPSSFFLMQWSHRYLVFADCAVNAQPSAAELAEIAIATALNAERLTGERSRVAFLSFSTHGSARHADVKRVAEAVRLAKQRAPALLIDGELQADAALSSEIAARKIRWPSEVAGRANVLIFPDLDAGNIAYKLVQYLGGAQAIGPVLQGFRKPLSDLSRGATVDDIVSTAVLLLAMA
jgi:phosphate acetyltransferase